MNLHTTALFSLILSPALALKTTAARPLDPLRCTSRRLLPRPGQVHLWRYDRAIRRGRRQRLRGGRAFPRHTHRAAASSLPAAVASSLPPVALAEACSSPSGYSHSPPIHPSFHPSARADGMRPLIVSGFPSRNRLRTRGDGRPPRTFSLLPLPLFSGTASSMPPYREPRNFSLPTPPPSPWPQLSSHSVTPSITSLAP
jgi:hypothetical protein